jgi:hypothetical protein
MFFAYDKNFLATKIKCRYIFYLCFIISREILRGLILTGTDHEESAIDIPDELARRRVCCIYRVPNKLRQVNKEAYTPKLVSIGPFHHGLEELKGMEKQKLIYFDDFCSWTWKSPKELSSIIEKNEKKNSSLLFRDL